jgi:chemotaxis protein methyltransferase CheR
MTGAASKARKKKYPGGRIMSATDDTLSDIDDRFSQQLLSEQQFHRFQSLIYDVVRVALPDSKRLMLSGRLAKRLSALKMDTFEEYWAYLENPDNLLREKQAMLNVITTNKTDFYRESYHFEYLVNTVLSELKRDTRIARGDSVEIWSAGCSSGEEPYTIAMELANALGIHQNFNVLATDISTAVLHRARQAVYGKSSIDPIPPNIKQKYLLRGKGEFEGQYRISPEIRKHVTFGRLNFANESYGINKKFHVIFCRNVMIYFDRETQRNTIRKLCDHLQPFGYLFIGHSETLEPQMFNLKKMVPTVYRRTK